MGERKVLNKYYPPDFDPAKLPRGRSRQQQQQQQQMKVRMMLAMNIRCNTCGHYMYKGTKFNSRKEHVISGGEKTTYLGIQILRFYFKCKNCCAEFTIKTDPQNEDYVVESGATQNFEPWRAAAEDQVVLAVADHQREKRMLDSKREMDRLGALDEIKSIRSRHEVVTLDAMLLEAAADKRCRQEEKEQEDEKLIKSITFKGSRNFVRRIQDKEFEKQLIATDMIKKPKRVKLSFE